MEHRWCSKKERCQKVKKEVKQRWSEYLGQLFSDEGKDLEDQTEDSESLKIRSPGERRETRNEEQGKR